MKRKMKAGSTSQTIEIIVLDKTKTDGSGLAGLTSGSAGLTWYYHRQGAAASVAVTLAAETLGTWTSGGFVAVDGTNAPGAYELGVPDLALATGAKYVTMFLRGAASMADVRIEIELDAVDYQNAASFITGVNGLAPPTRWNAMLIDVNGRIDVGNWLGHAVAVDANNLPNVNAADWGATAVGGMPYSGTPPTTAAIAAAVMTDVSDTVGADVVLIKAKTDQLVFTGAGNLKADVEQWLNGTIPAPNVVGVPQVDVTKIMGTTSAGVAGYVGIDWSHVNAPTTAVNLSGTTISTVSGNVGGNVVGQVGSVAGAVGSVTTPVTVGGYSANQDPETLVLNATASSFNTAGTIGAKINSAASAGDPWATTLPGSYVSGTAGNILGNRAGFLLAAAGLDSIFPESGVNARQTLAVIGSAVAGKLDGVGTGTQHTYAMNGSAVRITYTTDTTGRTSTSYNLP